MLKKLDPLGQSKGKIGTITCESCFDDLFEGFNFDSDGKTKHCSNDK
jgi:hypothetical protein